MPTIQEKLVKKWGPMVEHIRSDRKKAITAAMLEQENRYFKGTLNETGAGGFTVAGGDDNGATGNTQLSGIAKFKAIAMPLVARVFPELVTNDLVGVQPMFTPVGLAYALRYRYQTTAAGATAGDEAGFNTVHELYSGNNPVSGSTVPGSADLAAAFPSTVDNTRVAGEWANRAHGYLTAQGESLGEDNFGGSAGNDVRYMGLTVEKQQVSARTRKMAARWTHEAQQDLANQHGVDLPQELSDMLAYEVAAEIDHEVKNNIKALAQIGGVYSWSYGSMGNADGSADGRWEQEKFRSLYTLLVKASNDISIATRRSSGNFVLCSANVVTALEALEAFSGSSVATNMTTEVSGVAKVGQIGRLAVYRDNFATEDYAVVGYKGPRDNDAGVIYCPYVPLMFLDAVGQDSFNPRIGVMTRYGICNNLFGAENYYRYITIDFGDSPIAGYAV